MTCTYILILKLCVNKYNYTNILVIIYKYIYIILETIEYIRIELFKSIMDCKESVPILKP